MMCKLDLIAVVDAADFICSVSRRITVFEITRLGDVISLTAQPLLT